jgi:hypothetical protein
MSTKIENVGPRVFPRVSLSHLDECRQRFFKPITPQSLTGILPSVLDEISPCLSWHNIYLM